MLEQEKLREIIDLVIRLNPDNATTIRAVEFLVFHANSKKLIQDSIAIICQQPTDETEAGILSTLKDSIDNYFKGKPW